LIFVLLERAESDLGPAWNEAPRVPWNTPLLGFFRPYTRTCRVVQGVPGRLGLWRFPPIGCRLRLSALSLLQRCVSSIAASSAAFLTAPVSRKTSFIFLCSTVISPFPPPTSVQEHLSPERISENVAISVAVATPLFAFPFPLPSHPSPPRPTAEEVAARQQKKMLGPSARLRTSSFPPARALSDSRRRAAR